VAFEDAYNHVEDIVTRRWKELLSGGKRTWALETGTTLKEQIDARYESDTDNEAWEALYDDTIGADNSKMATYAARVAFECACERDLRTQYATGTECEVRRPSHRFVSHYTQSIGMLTALKRFKKINEFKNNKISEAQGE